MSKSIIQNKKECWFCNTTYNLHLHHIFEGTANRKVSDKNGFVVYLCGQHHNLSNDSVHFNRKMDLELKQYCEKEYLKNHTKEEFIKLIGKSYL